MGLALDALRNKRCGRPVIALNGLLGYHVLIPVIRTISHT